MKDFEVAQEIVQAVLSYEFEPFTLHIGGADIIIKEFELQEDEEDIQWLIFDGTVEDEEYTYGEYRFMIRVGGWGRNLFSNGESYYLIGYVNNNYHNEISLKRCLPSDVVEEQEIRIDSLISFASRDGKEKNIKRKQISLEILEGLDFDLIDNKVKVGTWSIHNYAFTKGLDAFIRNMLTITLIKAHFRKGEAFYIPGLPEVEADTHTDEGVLENMDVNVWKIAPGPDAEEWRTALEDKKIFVGWSDLGNLDDYESKEELFIKYQEVYETDKNPINDSFTLWSFCNDIKVGDIIFANKGGRSIVGIGRVTGDYNWIDDEYYPNVRTVDWIFNGQVFFDHKIFPNKTLSRIRSDKLEEIRKVFIEQVENGEDMWLLLFNNNQEKQDGLVDLFHHYVITRGFHFNKEVLARFIHSLRSKPLVILSGISGTGKTKIAQLFAEFMSTTKKQPKPVNFDSFFEYQLFPYNFTYSRMIIPVSLVQTLELSNLREGVEVTLSFGDSTEKALMKEEKQGHVRLGFRRGFLKWLNENFAIKDTIFIEVNDGGNLLKFKKDISSNVEPRIPQQWCFLSVRPDWLDHRGLLGYYNPILQNYEVTELLKIILRAKKYPEYPFFLILDEMNLSKVEYYFSDFLSCIESRRVSQDGEIKQEKITLHYESEEGITFTDENKVIYNIPNQIEVPQNLYIVGTVNIDETTYMFSPKVLDRAHVLEFNDIDFQSYLEDIGQAPLEPLLFNDEMVDWFTDCGHYHRKLYKKEYLNDINLIDKDKILVIEELNQLLKKDGFQFGYRVFDEILYFFTNVKCEKRWNDWDVLDILIHQKILPKLHGNRSQMDSLLKQLFSFCLSEEYEDLPYSINEDSEDYSLFRFPRSSEKIQSMYRQLIRTGYCSFIT